MNNFLKTIAETALFTNRCPICGSVIEFDKDLCDECLNAERISAPICLKCGCSKRRCICSRSKRNPEYKAVIAPFYYKNSISKVVLNLKMNSMPRLAGRQGKEIALSVKSLYELI
ncbi:MAG: double zinc ribbon domain-containing protein, partial [Clostridiales bacterium]|nr:double zinc ribbon domain-containing protein [Clostridiales bacterium]